MAISRTNLKVLQLIKTSQSILGKVSMGCDETFIDLLTELESPGAFEGFKEMAITGSKLTLSDEALEKTTSTRRSIDYTGALQDL